MNTISNEKSKIHPKIFRILFTSHGVIFLIFGLTLFLWMNLYYENYANFVFPLIFGIFGILIGVKGLYLGISTGLEGESGRFESKTFLIIHYIRIIGWVSLILINLQIQLPSLLYYKIGVFNIIYSFIPFIIELYFIMILRTESESFCLKKEKSFYTICAVLFLLSGLVILVLIEYFRQMGWMVQGIIIPISLLGIGSFSLIISVYLKKLPEI